jgi:glycosyltransferase involved in cell wall biosynthesis
VRALHILKTSTGARWALHQMRELVRLGLEVHVALPPDGPLVRACESAGIVVHRSQFDFPVRRPWTFPGIAKGVRALVASVQPDVIHSHFVGTTMSVRLALGGNHPIPRVFQVPGPLHLEHVLPRYAELLTAGQTDYWIGSCRWTRARYRAAGVPATRCFLSYYGADLDALSAGESGLLRRELALRPETRIVGMVAYMYAPRPWLGQVRGLKGHEDLIDAVALCLQRGADIVCVMVGGAWNGAHGYERQVREYARTKLGSRAVLLGARADVARLYGDFDLAVHPSHSENVGGAAESLLLGVPTIATCVGGFPDVISDGETGWLVPPRDPARLAEAILDGLSDSVHARRLAVEGQRRARQMLDVRDNARQIAGIYNVILATRARPRETVFVTSPHAG